jgi:hypothetical protein
MTVTNALAYHDAGLVAAAKSFFAQAPSFDVIKLFIFVDDERANNLERLPQTELCSLV